jgi:hypothetical protein
LVTRLKRSTTHRVFVELKIELSIFSPIDSLEIRISQNYIIRVDKFIL